MLAQIYSQLAAFLVAVPAIYVFRDHRAIIVSLATEAAVSCVVSHLLARKAFRLRSDRATFYSAVSFGVPLTLNGLGLALLSQLDRILIGIGSA